MKKKNKFYYRLYWLIIRVSRSNKLTRLIIDLLALYFYRLFRSKKTFIFNEDMYHYFYHFYNRTVAGERMIEIPIAKRVLDTYKAKKILEVGNVFSHYYPAEHDILDKYEKGQGVINKDVSNFTIKKKFDLIISVSTMEHVGWTYGERRDPGKFLRGLKNLERHLAPGGIMFVTFSLFYRDDLTDLVRSKKMPFKKEYFMKRVSFWNEWKQVDYKEAMMGDNYEGYYANANILYIGILEN